MKCESIILLFVVMAIAVMTSCRVVAQQNASMKNPLAVPTVALDKYGLFTVEDCPTTHDLLEVILHEGEYCIDRVEIFTDGMRMQSLPIREDESIVRKVVHFLDANFDGYVDILIGPGCNREYSALILWDPNENIFVRGTNDGFSVFNGDFFYDPGHKTVYRRTSSSFAETTYTKMTWLGTDLQSEETFLMVSDKSYYDSYHVTHSYTVRNYYSDEDIISTDDPTEILAPWDKWANNLFDE